MTTSQDLLQNLVMSSGYSKQYNDISGYLRDISLSGMTTGGVASQKPTTKTYYRTELIWVPPVKGSPGSPAIPPTPTQVSVSKNRGWNNSWARSVDPLVKDGLISLQFSNGIEGIFIGIGRSKKEGESIAQFSHALIADKGGISVYESGKTIKKLTSLQSSLSKIRFYRTSNNEIVYTVVTASETLIYKSTKLYTGINTYAYAYIYAAGDKVLDAEYLTGKVHYGSV